MARWIATLLIVALVGWVGVASAQTQAPAPPAAAGEKTMEGKVAKVDAAKKQITLEDGTSFTIPAGVQVDFASLTGKTAVIHYTEAGQMKTVKKVDVKS